MRGPRSNIPSRRSTACTPASAEKTPSHRIHVAQSHDKKPSSYYARVLKEARRRTIEELAVALDVTEEVAEARICAAARAAGELPSIN